MRQFTVQKAISLGYDSHVHRLTSPRHKLLKPGAIIRLDIEAPNGNVWFIDEDGERGKIECGDVPNLTRDGRVVETPNADHQARVLPSPDDLVGRSVPDLVAAEIKATWRAARDAGGEMAAFRIIERMVDRLGYGRTENNPSLVPNVKVED